MASTVFPRWLCRRFAGRGSGLAVEAALRGSSREGLLLQGDQFADAFFRQIQ